jgi:hypothetical protein
MTHGQRAYEAWFKAAKISPTPWGELEEVDKSIWEAGAAAARTRAPAKLKVVYPDCFWVLCNYRGQHPRLQQGKRLPDGADWRKRNRVRMADGLLHYPSNVYPTKRKAVAAYLRDLRERVQREERDTREAKRNLSRGETFAKRVFK